MSDSNITKQDSSPSYNYQGGLPAGSASSTLSTATSGITTGGISGVITGGASGVTTPNPETSTITHSDATGNKPSSYTNPPANPALTPPPSTATPSAADAATEHIFNFTNILNNILSNSGGAIPGSAADKANQDEADAQVTDPAVIALAEQNDVPPSEVEAAVQTETSTDLDAQLANLPPDVANLPNAAAQLKLAYYEPQLAASLSPAMQAALTAIKQTINSDLQTLFGLPSTWTATPDPTSFNNQLNSEYDSDFEALVDGDVANGTLSAADAQIIKTLHYMPGTSAPANLVNLANQYNSDATEEMQEKYGIGSNWTPEPNTSSYTDVLNGAFRDALLNLQPPLTDDQTNQINAALANPGGTVDPSIQAIINKAIAAVSAQFGVSATWTPSVTTVLPPGVTPAEISMLNTGIQMAKTTLAGAEAEVSKMPPGPEQASLMNYLQLIGAQINMAQQAIYALEGSQSKVSGNLSKAQLGTALDNLSQQMQAMNNVEAKEAKMAKLGPLEDLVKWIMAIVAVVIGILSFGTLSAVFAIFYFADMANAEVTKKPSLTQQLFTSLQDKLGPGGAAGASIGLEIGLFMLTGNPIICFQTFFGEANVIGNIIKACGGNAEQAAIGNMVVQMTLEIAAMIVMMVVTGGAAAPAVAAEVAGGIGEATGDALAATAEVLPNAIGEGITEAGRAIANVLKVSEKVGSIIAQSAEVGMNVTIAGLQAGASGSEAWNSAISAEIDIIQGVSDAYSANVQATVEMLKKLVDLLLSELAGQSDNITSLSNLQGKKWDAASQVLSNIFS